jgi:hypothetical protein
MIKDHYDFYRDNFINDQIDLDSMFPEHHSAQKYAGQVKEAIQGPLFRNMPD